MKQIVLGLGLLLGSAAASAQSVEVAGGDWTNVPAIEAAGEHRISNEILDRMHELAAQGVCEVPGMRRNRINLTIPFVLRFTEQGGIERVVVRNMGCPQLETLLGGVVLELARAGEYRPTGENLERWYRSELSFVSR